MSCIPFETGQPKKQIVPTTVERNFERVYGKLQHLKELSRRLQKDMKSEISLDLFSIPLCEEDQDFVNLVTALDVAIRWMDALHQGKVNQIQRTVIEPLQKFGSVFPSLTWW